MNNTSPTSYNIPGKVFCPLNQKESLLTELVIMEEKYQKAILAGKNFSVLKALRKQINVLREKLKQIDQLKN